MKSATPTRPAQGVLGVIDLDDIRRQVAEFRRCVREGEDAGFAFRNDPRDLVIALLAEVDRLREHVQSAHPKTDPRLQQVLDALHENYPSMATNARPVSGGWEIRISSGALAAVVTIYTSGKATTGGKDTSLRRDARSILEGLGYDVRC